MLDHTIQPVYPLMADDLPIFVALEVALFVRDIRISKHQQVYSSAT